MRVKCNPINAVFFILKLISQRMLYLEILNFEYAVQVKKQDVIFYFLFVDICFVTISSVSLPLVRSYRLLVFY